MALSNDELKKYMKRLLLSRLRILINNGFYGLLLMHMIYSIDENCDTAATDGERIYFGPKFMDELSDSELDFILMHEILHVVLQHCFRHGDRNDKQFNIACDIVVNSNILRSNHMNLQTITLNKYGESMHIAPDGKEGYEYTAEQVYEMLSPMPSGNNNKSSLAGAPCAGDDKGEEEDDDDDDGKVSALGRAKQEKGEAGRSGLEDDHSKWGMEEEDDTLRDVWVKRLSDACEAISIRDPSNKRGILPLFAERLLNELRTPQTDWRMILNDFVQEEIVDYSFTPPDRRFDESPFFLPDFNDKEELLKNILFMIDTSGSMSDDEITAAYSEVKGAIDQFDGKLEGWLGFFDAAIIEPIKFSDIEEFKIIKPQGGGGTDFQIIFEYVYKYMQDDPPVSIIILTDGYAPYPKEKLAMGIPVLWIINNEDVTPPWGKVARIK
jgi:predicted metal-dependent peptidase